MKSTICTANKWSSKTLLDKVTYQHDLGTSQLLFKTVFFGNLACWTISEMKT